MTSWPIHPQPLEDESLTSWVGRLAIANGVPVRSFLSYCFGEGEWRRRDLDLLDNEKLARISSIGSSQGGEEALRDMVLTRWKATVAGHEEADQKSWVNSLSVTRYCPSCFSSDSIPYLRLMWRLHFMPVCPKHSALIYSRCWKCRRHQSIIRFHTEKQAATCRSCGSALSGAPVIRPQDCDVLFRFSSRARQILDGILPNEFDWPYTVNEFFDVLRFTVRFLNLWQQRTQSWEKDLKSYGLPVAPPFDWRRNEAVSCLLLERALELLEHWPRNMKIFTRSEQTRFNILCREYERDLPPSLAQFKGSPKGGGHGIIASTCEFPSAEFDRTAVRMATRFLARSDWAITGTTVSRLTRIRRKELIANSSLGGIINEERRRAEERQKAQVRKAIAALTRRKIRPSIRSVATYLGRPEWFIQKNPELTRIVKLSLGEPGKR